MNVQDCLDKGLLKRISPNKEWSRRSLDRARQKHALAKRCVDAELYDMAVVNAYSAIFHAARALLFKDGFREKSHYAIYVYIEERYKEKIEPRHITTLNLLRLERHEIFYGLDTQDIPRKEAKEHLAQAQAFVEAVGRLLHKLD